MMKADNIKKIKYLISSVLAAAGIMAAIRYSKACSAGIENGISFCASVLVPSLYIFMILTAYIIKSGCAEMISTPFGGLMRLFGLPKQSASAVLLSMIGGYPIGAGCAELLYDDGQLSESEAAKTAYIAFAAGPGFIVNYVGRNLLNSRYAGNILMISQITSVIVTGLTVGRLIKAEPITDRRIFSREHDNAFVEAVDSASRAVLRMCAMVILFSAIVEVMTQILERDIADILSAFLEVTVGCNRLTANSPLYVTAFFIGFGGSSVHFQIFSALKNIRISKLRFIAFRVLQGIISAAAAYIYLMISPIKADVFSSVSVPLSAMNYATLAGSGAIIFASVCFIGSVSGRIRRIGYVRNSRMDRQ